MNQTPVGADLSCTPPIYRPLVQVLMSAFYSECSLLRSPGEPILCHSQQVKNGTSEMHQLKLCTFKGIQNLPLYVARQQNFFAQQDLHIDITYTTGSIPQLAGLVRDGLRQHPP